MPRSTQIALAVILLLVIGFGGYLLLRGNADDAFDRTQNELISD